MTRSKGVMIVCGHSCSVGNRTKRGWCNKTTVAPMTGQKDKKHGQRHKNCTCFGALITMDMPEYIQYSYSGCVRCSMLHLYHELGINQ